ncbi:MAG: rod shape-determining protein MreC [Ignavibacteriaceae bacterium]
MIRFFTSLWENFKEYIVLVLLVILSLVLLSQNQSAGIKKVRTLAFGTFAAVSSVVNNLFSTSSLRNENEKLREINAQLMLQISKLREYGITGQELKGLIGLKDTSTYPLIPATIVSKSLSKVQGTFTLNIGAADGVLPGMPVITHQGLVGIINSVSENFSILRTLQNVDLKLTVKCERTREHAVMKWTGDDLLMINIPKTFAIEPGDRLVTSEISSIVPVPIPVGVSAEFGNSETGIFNEIKVIPFVDFYKTEYVFVLGVVSNEQINKFDLNIKN